MRRRRGWIVLVALLAVPSGAWALGASSGRDVIQPAVDFRATLTDRDGTAVDCTRVNAGGEIQLEGEMGRGRLKVAFDNIQRIDFAADARDHVRATVHLKGGDTVELQVRNSVTFYGQTTVGLYQIRARDLRQIDFSK